LQAVYTTGGSTGLNPCCSLPRRFICSVCDPVWQASRGQLLPGRVATDGDAGCFRENVAAGGVVCGLVDFCSTPRETPVGAILGRAASGTSCGSKKLSRVRAKRIKPIIGLVGGIGAGKSSVARVLQSLGAAVIDSDRLAHDELADPEVIATLRGWWGDKVCPSDEVDRKALASIVFSDPHELDRLEKLLYPRIHRRRERLVAGYNADPAVRAIVLDAPKLYEAGLGDYCDAVIFVAADWSVRVRRVAASRGWTEEELRRRENLQNSLDTKRANADHVVINHSSLDQLRIDVERIFFSVLAAFA